MIENNTIKCYGCKKNKNLNDFSKSQIKRGSGLCRECNSKRSKDYRNKNPDKKYHEQEKHKNKRKKYYEENKTKIILKQKEYNEKNKDKKIKYRKEYKEKNKDKIKNQNREYSKNKRKNDECFRLRALVSSAICNFLRKDNLKKKSSCIKYLPFTLEELKSHLEKLFEPWMNWTNQGVYNPKTWNDNDQSTWTWQIDHIIPHSSFNYISMEEDDFKKCWDLSNLRPLSSKENILKSNKMDISLQ